MNSAQIKRLEDLEHRCAAYEQLFTAIFRRLPDRERNEIYQELSDNNKRHGKPEVLANIGRIVLG